MRFPRFLVLFLAAALASKALGASPKSIPPDKRVAIVAAFDPLFRGQKVGITAFGNESWTVADPGFDVNSWVVQAMRPKVNREVRFATAREVGLPSADLTKRKEAEADGNIAPQLVTLGRDWHVDVIVILDAFRSRDYISDTNQPIVGHGYFKRQPGAVYCMWRIRSFDCQTGQFTGKADVRSAQRLPSIEWHKTWNDFSVEEKRLITRGFETLLKESATEVLATVGLNAEEFHKPSQSLGSILFQPPSRRVSSFIPEGNLLEIPVGVSPTGAHDAVVSGFKGRGWTVTEDTPGKVTGVYREKQKEAGCTATISAAGVELVFTDFEIKPDGRRLPATYRRWDNNLKESIFEILLAAPPAE